MCLWQLFKQSGAKVLIRIKLFAVFERYFGSFKINQYFRRRNACRKACIESSEHFTNNLSLPRYESISDK